MKRLLEKLFLEGFLGF